MYVPALAEADEDSDSTPGLIAVRGKGAPKGGKRSGKKLLALTDGTADDSNDSMPELQSVSDSSESEEDDSDSDDDSNTTESDDEDSDAGYDTDEEDELREMMKEAMNAAMENPDFFDPKADPKDFQVFNEIAEERKGNPFLKLLGSLRGMFTMLIGASFFNICVNTRYCTRPRLQVQSEIENHDQNRNSRGFFSWKAYSTQTIHKDSENYWRSFIRWTSPPQG